MKIKVAVYNSVIYQKLKIYLVIEEINELELEAIIPFLEENKNLQISAYEKLKEIHGNDEDLKKFFSYIKSINIINEEDYKIYLCDFETAEAEIKEKPQTYQKEKPNYYSSLFCSVIYPRPQEQAIKTLEEEAIQESWHREDKQTEKHKEKKDKQTIWERFAPAIFKHGEMKNRTHSNSNLQEWKKTSTGAYQKSKEERSENSSVKPRSSFLKYFI